MWVAVGRSATGDDSGTILHSSDGITWTASSEGVAFSVGVGVGGRAVAYNPIDKMWVAVGNSTESSKTILHSSDGITWKNSSADKFGTGGYGNGVAYNPVDKMWVAVGSGPESSKTILHSSDGITWSASSEGVAFSVGVGGGGLGVAYNPIDKMWVAVGESSTGDNSGTILHSSDGITWSASSEGVAFDGSGGWGVAYNPIDKMWVAVGFNATSDPGTILHSSDGITWSASLGGEAFKSTAAEGGRAVAYNPIDKMWVAVGNSTESSKTILHSSDGITWSASSGEAFSAAAAEGGNGVAYNPIDKMWVAVGYSATDNSKTILHSSDGITWSASSGEAFLAVNGGGFGVAYTPGLVVPIGNLNNLTV